MRAQTSILTAFALLTFGCATVPTEPLPAPVAPSPRPTFRPDERWEWTSRIERFLREEAGLLVFEVTSSQGYRATRYRTKDLNLVKDIQVAGESDRVSALRDPHSGYLRFPLSLGASWTHTYKNIQLSGDVVRNANYEVAAYEKITIRGRSYAVYRIEGLDQRSDRPYGIRVTIWYGPEVKNVVKFLGVDDSNNQIIPGFDFELVRYEPA